MILYIGLMSGTSMDGIDVALVDVSTNTLIAGLTRQYSMDVKERVLKVSDGNPVHLASLCELNTLIGREFAAATNQLLTESGFLAQDVVAIGSHGQTICHDTCGEIPYTLQVGCAHTISALTGITVVADFRTRDIVNGGQGAPFAPLYHHELFKDASHDVAVVNIGGIANISLISPHSYTQGWDVGPGNCLMDAWIYRHLGKSYDEDGAWAAQGQVIPELLNQLLSDPFFALPSPKSIGKEYFSMAWLDKHLNNTARPQDVQATLLALTTYAISRAVQSVNHEPIRALYLCGGGTHNVKLSSVLQSLLTETKIESSSAVNINPDFLEAMMFAWLASKTIQHQTIDLSHITGSNQAEILGAIYPI